MLTLNSVLSIIALSQKNWFSKDNPG